MKRGSVCVCVCVGGVRNQREPYWGDGLQLWLRRGGGSESGEVSWVALCALLLLLCHSRIDG